MADGNRSSDAGRWYTAAELAGLPGVPGTERRIRSRAEAAGWTSRRRARGKGFEYSLASLPPETQAALLLRERREHSASAGTQAALPVRGGKRCWTEAQISAEWARYERLSQARKEVAQIRLRAMQAVDGMVASGIPLMQARASVAAQMQRDGVRGVSMARLAALQSRLGDAPRHHWLPLLADRYVGRSVTAECSPLAWAQLTALYLSLRAPAFQTCYDRVQRTAEKEGWLLPSAKTLWRRLLREYPPQEIAYARGGQEALEKLFPAQQRDRSMFAALEAVNGDGVLFVPWVVFPTGELARPKVWFWQCLGTGKVLAWRADVSENTEMLRLAFGDLVERYGLPRLIFLDNTMAAANKKMTAGNAGKRYRQFGRKIKEEDIVGVMPACGCEVRFTRPAHGQSKPIERAFRDLRELIDHHPKYGNRGTKQRPLPLAEWLAIMEAEVAAHNARPGRRGAHFAGRSFDQVFADSMRTASVRRATAEQRRLWLLAAEQVTVSRADGSICLGRGPQGDNRYWSEALLPYMGEKVTVRFDPQNLHAAVHVYSPTGTYIGEAECTWRQGFATTERGQAYHRARGQFEKATKAALKAKQAMDELSAAERVPDVVPPPVPNPAVVQGQFGRRGESAGEEEARTGTDDVRGSAALYSFLGRVQQQQQEGKA